VEVLVLRVEMLGMWSSLPFFEFMDRPPSSRASAADEEDEERLEALELE